MYKTIYTFIIILMLQGCVSMNPLKWFDSAKPPAESEASINSKPLDAQIAYWKDRAEIAEAKTDGMSAGKKYTIYLAGLCFGIAGVFLFTIPMRKLAIAAIGSGVVCWCAPSTIDALEGVGETIGTIVNGAIWIAAGGGALYVVWILKGKLKQSVHVGQKAKKILQQKLTTDDYEKAKEIIHQGAEPCKIIDKIKGK